jgi:hypothetical protein
MSDQAKLKERAHNQDLQIERARIRRMMVPPSRYTPITDTDDGHIAGIVLIGGALFVLILVLGILWLEG